MNRELLQELFCLICALVCGMIPPGAAGKEKPLFRVTAVSYSTRDGYIYQAIMAIDGSKGWLMSCYANPELGLTGVPLPSWCHWLEPNEVVWAKIGHDKIEVYAPKRHADGKVRLDKQGKPKMRWLRFRIIKMMDAKQIQEENHGPDTHGPESPNPQH